MERAHGSPCVSAPVGVRTGVNRECASAGRMPRRSPGQRRLRSHTLAKATCCRKSARSRGVAGAGGRTCGTTAPCRRNRCGSRRDRGEALRASPTSKQHLRVTHRIAVLFAVVGNGEGRQSTRAGLVHRLDDKLHKRRVVDFEVQAGVPPSGLAEDVEDGLH